MTESTEPPIFTLDERPGPQTLAEQRRRREQQREQQRELLSTLTDRQREALEYARSYWGRTGFMRAMRQKAKRPLWVPTDKETNAILGCRNREHPVGPRNPE